MARPSRESENSDDENLEPTKSDLSTTMFSAPNAAASGVPILLSAACWSSPSRISVLI